jgi:hypothetical protein
MRYECPREKETCRGPRCQSLAGRVLDEFVAKQVLAALEPAALELSIAAADDVQQERQRLTEHWQQRLERARYQTGRAERQYNAVEPENRLIARELERRWEAALKQERHLEAEYEQFCRTQPIGLSSEERAVILKLAKDVPALWYAGSTTPADRQRIVRLVLNRVIVNIQGISEHVDVTLEWAGGFTSQHEVIRTVFRYAQQADFGRLKERVQGLHSAGNSLQQVADVLNREGFRPVKPVDQFDKEMVAPILAQYILAPSKQRRRSVGARLEKNEWLVRDLAKKLKVSKTNLHRWIQLGWIHSRRLPGLQRTVIC